MILGFAVENFRSFKEGQSFNLYAEYSKKNHVDNMVEMLDGFSVLRTSAIYGSNASGKSNLLKAFGALQGLIVDSSDWKEGDSIPVYEPYLLSEDTVHSSTKFDIEFYFEGLRYSYIVEFNSKEIIYERLDAYYSAKPSKLFERNSPDDWKKGISFGDRFKGDIRKIPFFPNNTYLSKAGNTAGSPDIAREIYHFFRKKIDVLLCNDKADILGWYNRKEVVDIVNVFLKNIDLGIERFDIERDEDIKKDIMETIGISSEKTNLLSEHLRDVFFDQFADKSVFYHASDKGGSVRFEEDQESDGTKKIFKSLPHILYVLYSGSVLLVDELEGSYHPHIAELIVKLFNDPDVNMNNAQLIFTTHNLSLMSPNLLRKDQINLVGKGLNGSELTSLDEYDDNLKDSSPFSKWYDDGRLGYIPSISYNNISSAIKGFVSKG